MTGAGAAEQAIHRAMDVMLRPRPAREGAPGRLDLLFDELTDPLSADPPHEIEDAIWDLWSAHDDPEAEGLMSRTIAAIARREEDEATALAELLVDGWPDWAEAWNKRATLRFITDDHLGSVGDIVETLIREPRHFGAMSGLGQICLERGDPRSAMAAFDAALAVNPHLHQIRALRTELGESAPKTN